MLEAARTDSVRAFFIFLHLLERNAERFAELRLGPPKHHAAHAHAASHMFVSRVCSVLWHRVPVSPAALVGGYTTCAGGGNGGQAASDLQDRAGNGRAMDLQSGGVQGHGVEPRDALWSLGWREGSWPQSWDLIGWSPLKIGRPT